MATVGVIGLGRLGAAVACYLGDHGVEVIAVDTDPQRVDAVKERVGRAMQMDATDERAMRASGLGECDTVVLAMAADEVENAALATIILRDLGVGRIVARAGSDVQARVLERLGVAEIVFPERQIGLQLARRIFAPSETQLVALSTGTSVGEVPIPTPLVGKTLAEIELRAKHGLNAVAVRRRREVVRDDGSIDVQWDTEDAGATTRLVTGDVLIVVGTDERIRALAEL